MGKDWYEDKWMEIENAMVIACPAFKHGFKCKIPELRDKCKCGNTPCEVKIVCWNSNWKWNE